MKIRFLVNHKVKQGDGKGPLYEAGKTYDFDGIVSATYARKYIARGYAELVTEPVRSKGKTGKGGKIEVEAIEIQQRMDGEVRKLFVMKPWPQRTRIAQEFLDGQDASLKMDGEALTVTVENGVAVYQREAAQDDLLAPTFSLVEQAYEEAPAAPPVNPT